MTKLNIRQSDIDASNDAIDLLNELEVVVDNFIMESDNFYPLSIALAAALLSRNAFKLYTQHCERSGEHLPGDYAQFINEVTEISMPLDEGSIN